jgi:hypothetical protein
LLIRNFYDLPATVTVSYLTGNTVVGSTTASTSDSGFHWSYSFSNVGTGTYGLLVSGAFAEPNSVANFVGVTSNVVAPPPVPEPETYAMLLAGLGALGFMGRRRKSTKV